MSEEKDLNNDEVVDNASDGESTDDQKSEPTAEERYGELNDKYIRIHAEFDNYRKRTNKEKLDIINSANAGVLKDLLSIMDDFERAIENNKNAEDIDGVKEGFNLIFNKMKGTLESKGLKPMDSTGQNFDVELHEAIANIPAPSKKQKGKVIEAIEKGYYLNDKVIRFAKVVVGQ
jgi:molecular chaperone GrpE